MRARKASAALAAARPTAFAARLEQGNDALAAAKQAASAMFLRPAAPRGLISAMSATTAPDSNVVGVGIGRKIKGETITDTPCVRIYVAHKVAPASVPSGDMIPPSIGGVPTDVIESGRIRAFPIAQTKLRPAKGGCSVGFKFPPGPMAGFVMAGTFGALVSDGASRFVLSNNHVLANANLLPLGAPIFQPGLLDGGNPATDQIAVLAKFIKILRPPAGNSVDAAIAKLLTPALAIGTILPSVGKLASAAPIGAAIGMLVHKHGRTTGYRKGHITDISADIRVEYEDASGQPFVARFDDQIAIESDTSGVAFSAGGDSGSLIVSRATKQATGLLFAGSPTMTFANHIGQVLGRLGATLVP